MGWVVGFLLITVLTFFGVVFLGGITALFIPATPIGNYSLLLLTFVPLFVAIPLIYKRWHGLPIKALMTSASHFRWGHLLRTMFIIFVFYGVMSFGEYLLFPGKYAGLLFQSDLTVYLKLLIVTLILVPFQAASEEFLCRGYLNQALIKYLRSPWVVFSITSGGFALLHAWNPESSGQMGPYLASIFLFGMAMCVLLYLEGGIESAIGAHIANNIFVFAVLGYEDPMLPNTALFTTGEPVIGWTDFGIEFVTTIILIALIIWANRKWGRSP